MKMRLRHIREVSGPCGVEVVLPGTIVEAKQSDTDPEYADVEYDGLDWRIHWDELDPVDEPYGDTNE